MTFLGHSDLARYDVGELLGRGGMGEVLLAHDPEIGRDVALKRMRAADPDDEAVERFLREAKIQARLDHPAIVPVHELGHDAEGRPYFTMKRLTGVTLASVLEKGGATPQRLLRALVDVCLAIELAHSRDVVHRDLKPSNIMLGDYGEVYVLDWGVAYLTSEGPSAISNRWRISPLPALETQTGAMLGTPGYMAPEQMRGDAITGATDVYALGTMLFEILAGEPLHPRRSQLGTGANTVGLDPDADTKAITVDRYIGAVTSPAKRRPDRGIAPELDAACIAALADDPSVRPTARVLAERIQRYLDGDRDVEQRRALAAAELVIARAAIASDEPARRSEAVHAAGRALALDPSSREAADLVTSLIVEPPPHLPAELEAAVASEEEALSRDHSQRAIPALLALLVLFTPVVFLLPVIDWMWVIVIYVGLAMWIGTTWASARRINTPVGFVLALLFAFPLVFSRVLGPFVLTPILICALLPSISAIPWVNDRRWAFVGWTIATGLAPFVLEWLGVLSPTWQATHAGLLTTSAVFDTSSTLAAVLTVTANLLFLPAVAIYTLDVTRDRRSAQRRLQIQAWHLRQLLPRRA